MTSGSLLIIGLVDALACAVIGGIVGSRKGDPTLGFILGLAIGVIGVVIIAVKRPNHEEMVRREQARLRIAADAAGRHAQDR